MMKQLLKSLVVVVGLLSIGFVQSCKNKNPSVIKVFVRSASNELQTGASVVIIADVDNNESTVEYVDTLLTNESGYVEFNLKAYYDKVNKGVEVGSFDVICRKNNIEGKGYIRSRVYTTAVETIYLQN